MSKRLALPVACIIFGFILIGIVSSNTPVSHAQEGERNLAALRGSAVYAEFCSACHGPKGEAIGSAPGFVSIAEFDPATVRAQIVEGYDSDENTPVKMVGYGIEAGGPLQSTQIDDVVAYMLTWQTGDTPELPDAQLEPGAVVYTGPGNPSEGATVYAYACLGCHGRDAKGRGKANFPRFTIDENSVRVAATGDGHGFVPAFADNAGGPLAPQQLDNLDAYLRTIDVEKEEEGPQGVTILLMVLGLGAVGIVGGVYVAANRQGRAAG
ncbi:MAG: c-type cytochrome [Chloroflexi bacterium]|nr:c-type cytochrome [Chloroflexota bacterium]